MAPVVAILDASSRTSPSAVLWQDLGALTSGHRVPDVHGLWYHRLPRDPGAPVIAAGPTGPRVRRALARAVGRVGALGAFLGTDRLRLGGGALCEVIDPPTPSVCVFAPVCANGRRYHVHVKGADALPASIREFGTVTFVTGFCLFSSRVLEVIGVDGTAFDCLAPRAASINVPLSRIDASADLSIYELESAHRLPWLTTDMISLVPAEIPVTVTIDVPRIQYYLYLLEAFYGGLVAPELMLRWFELVDERSRRVTSLLRHRLRATLPLADTSRRIRLRRAANMACLEVPVRHSVASGKRLDVDQMAELLSADDPIWAMSLAAVGPSGYRDLINLSYAVEQVRGGVAHKGDAQPLSIAIDNPSERRACTEARAVVRAARATGRKGDGSIVGLYPLERAFTSEATGTSDLYHYDPGDSFLDRAGQQYRIAELVSRLYPELEPRLAIGDNPGRPRAAAIGAHLA